MFHEIRWTYEKLLQRLKLIEPLVFPRQHTLSPFYFKETSIDISKQPIPSNYPPDGWQLIPWETYWGGYDLNFMLHTEFQIHQEWKNFGSLKLYLPIGSSDDFSHPEAQVYLDGNAIASCDRHHQEILIPNSFRDGANHALTLFGWTGRLKQGPGHKLFMHECSLVQVHQPTRDFIATARVALGVVDYLSQHDPVRINLLNALDEAFKVLDTRHPIHDRFYSTLESAHQALLKGIDRSGPPLDLEIFAIGHAHIDVAWLWPLDQTRQKTNRTFLNVLRLMDEHIGFRFTQSQPQLYEFIREENPALFKAITKRIKEGRWEPIGGMWVEADCNLSGGESLARQFLLGRTFFREQFGENAETRVLWLPDVFGYAWNLPQLIKEANLDYFFTIKLGWSEYNRLPYDTFWWQGLDGTRVLTHFSTTHEPGSEMTSTYNAKATPQETLSTWTNFQQKDWGRPGTLPPLLMSFGYGDGGGGPTREMIENIREMREFPATPQVRFGSVREFFQKLEEDVGDRLPVWNGELYLEYHRGTYTTQARNKRANRVSEFLLHDAEFLGCVADVLDPNYAYPHQDLENAWKLVCLNQFHDILPGSSIGEVYEESLEQYGEVERLGSQVIENALSVIAESLKGDVLLVNPTSFSRDDLAFMHTESSDAPVLRREGDFEVKIQEVEGGFLLSAGGVPPYSVTTLKITSLRTEKAEERPQVSATPLLLENRFLRVELNQAGDIIRIFDKENEREVLPPGAVANQFQAFEDRPRTPDAWEIDIYYDDRVWHSEPPSSIEVIEDGPLRATIEIQRKILNSDISQRISIVRDSRRIDFDTKVTWREKHTLMKVAFPVNVLSPKATYEIQWGNVERPTHRNTSWDWARFETCAQKWVDLSQGDYGVSLLNDSKYGHDILGNVMRISLLRGSTYPDPEADQGEHQFVYSLLPHTGGWNERTIPEAYALNDPLKIYDASKENVETNEPQTGDGSGGGSWSYVRIDSPNVVIETIKKAEDGRGHIVRMYESHRKRGSCTLHFGFPLQEVWRTNLLEENLERIATMEDATTIDIKPYQIITLRVVPADSPREPRIPRKLA